MVANRGIVGFVAVTMLGAVLTGCFWNRGSEKEVVVFAASSLNGSLQEIGRLFEAATEYRVAFNFAGSNVLARQLVASVEADIYISADDQWMDFVEESGEVHSETRRDLLENTLVALCAAEATWGPVSNVSELAELDFRVLCVSDPVAVPAGRYARQWLSNSGMGQTNAWAAIAERLSPSSDVKATLAQTLSRRDAVGIVYWTDYLERKNEARLLLKNDEFEARYPIALTRSGMEKQPAGAFFRFVQSDAALEIFRNYGFAIASMVESE